MNLQRVIIPLRALWAWLTEPAVVVQQPEQRRQSRLLASLLVALVIATLLVVGVVHLYYFATPLLEDDLFMLGIGFIGFLLIPYSLSRRGHYQPAVMLTLIAYSIGLLLAASSGEFADIHFLYNLLLAVLISSAFLSIRTTLLVVMAEVVGMFIVAATGPARFAPYIIYGPLCSVIMGSVLIWLFSHHQRKLIRDRQALLAQSEEKNRLLVELTREGIFIHSLEGEVLDCNPAGCQMFGYSRDELVGLNIRDLVTEDFARRLPAVIAEDTGGEYRQRVNRKKDGTLFPTELRTQFFTVGGEKRLIAFVHDVTKRKQAEAALRDSDEKNRLLVELAREGIFIETVEGEILDCNPAGCEIFGYPKEEMVGMHIRDIVSDEFAATLPPVIEEVTNGEFLERVDKKKDGTLFPIEIATLFFTVGGEKRLIAFVRDISERKQAEAALRASEERYRLISESLSDYAYSYRVEPDGAFTHEWITEESFQNVTGYTWQEIDALEPFTLFHPDERPRLPQQQEQLRRGEPVSDEYRIIKKDSEMRWLHIERRLVWDDNSVVRLLCTAKDITERKLSEEQKLKLALERERLTFVSRFVMAISHDFRTALANVETSRYLIQRKLPDADREIVQPRLDTIHEAVTHLTEQLGNLHTISFLAAPNPEVCNLNTLVEGLVRAHQQQAQDNNIAIAFSPNHTLPLLQVDKDEFQRALRHLLVNAITHTPEGGAINMRTYRDKLGVSVEVADTGSGIDREHMAHIFDPFYRGDSSRSTDSGGIGLGLSIVKMVAEAHGGSVAVQSTPGNGSVFTVTLPVVAERS